MQILRQEAVKKSLNYELFIVLDLSLVEQFFTYFVENFSHVREIY